MGKGSKFIIIGLLILFAVSIYFLLQLFQQRQALQQNYTEIKEKLNTQTAEWSAKVSQLKKDAETAQSKASQLEKQMAALSEERNSLEAKYNTLLKEKEELVEKLQSLAQAKKQEVPPSPGEVGLTPTIGESDQYWAGVLKQKADLELKLSDLKDVITDLQLKLDSATKEKGDLSLQVSQLTQENKDLTRKADYNDRLSGNLSTDLMREQKDKKEILDQLTLIKQENLSLRAKLKELDKANLSLKEKLRTIEGARLDLEQRVDQINVSLDKKMDEVANLTKEIKSLPGQEKFSASKTKYDGDSKDVDLPPIVVRSNKEEAINELKIISGKIIALNEANNFVVINLGESQGITIGRKFEVLRNDVSIGRLEVIQTRKNISAADIVSMDAKRKIKIGDTVK